MSQDAPALHRAASSEERTLDLNRRWCRLFRLLDLGALRTTLEAGTH